MSREQVVKNLQFPKYKDWRNADTAPDNITAMYHLSDYRQSQFISTADE